MALRGEAAAPRRLAELAADQYARPPRTFRRRRERQVPCGWTALRPLAGATDRGFKLRFGVQTLNGGIATL